MRGSARQACYHHIPSALSAQRIHAFYRVPCGYMIRSRRISASQYKKLHFKLWSVIECPVWCWHQIEVTTLCAPIKCLDISDNAIFYHQQHFKSVIDAIGTRYNLMRVTLKVIAAIFVVFHVLNGIRNRITNLDVAIHTNYQLTLRQTHAFALFGEDVLDNTGKKQKDKQSNHHTTSLSDW